MELKHSTISVILICTAIGASVCGCKEKQKISVQSALENSPTALKETVVVPTLDSPMPTGKNVVWCSSFQLAWNKLKEDVCRSSGRMRQKGL